MQRGAPALPIAAVCYNESMRKTWLALAAALAATAVLAGEPGRTIGKVKIEKDGALAFEARGGPFQLVVTDATEFVAFESKTLGEGDGGKSAHLLGKKISGGTDTASGSHVPESIGQVSIIVIGDGFEPPPLPADVAAKGTKWLGGTLSHDASGGWNFSGTMVAIGRDARAIVIEKAEAKDAKKGMIALVTGPVDKAAKKIEAKRVALCGRDIDANDLHLLFGL